jgi:hypothetical protein
VNTIYTFGYTGSTPGDLTAFAGTLGAKIVDVRLSPRSRVPHWVGAALGKKHADDYVHVPAFGNRNYNNGGPIELADPTAGVELVSQILAARPVILLCACAEPALCHRSLVALHLAAVSGAPIIDLPTRFASWQTRQAGRARQTALGIDA